jgi:pimeloyl-ACP methyl ester carboxylesterase
MARSRGLAITAGLLLAGAGLVWGRFDADLDAARSRVAAGSIVLDTPCGAIEYQEAGAGVPLLAVHGSGGGFDQGMAFAAPLAAKGVRVIAPSRFGYLRTPMPEDASAQAQADAFVCLLDALDIDKAAVMGGSAGALSALQMAIRHPDRVSALVLLVPLAWKPLTEADSAEPMAPWIEAAIMSVIGSDFLFWSAQHLARGQLIGTVLATPPELLETASAEERARIDAMVDNILPVSARAAGLRSDTAASKGLTEAALDRVTAPTLIISARDDRYGTYAAAEYTASRIAGARFLGFDTGGHTWVGHNDEVMAAILDVIIPPVAASGP